VLVPASVYDVQLGDGQTKGETVGVGETTGGGFIVPPPPPHEANERPIAHAKANAR